MRRLSNSPIRCLYFILFALCLIPTAGISARAQGTTAFTYQGKLTDSGVPATGNFDLQFTLFDQFTGGTQQGGQLSLPGIPVAGGIFSVQLDFGAGVFTTSGTRFLEIGVRPGGSSGSFVTLAPRQPVTPAPYAIRSQSAVNADTATTAASATTATNAVNATNATNAAQLGGVAAAQYIVTSDPRLTDARNPLPGSASYIQNGTAPQAAANFNISGSGTAGGTLAANAVDATTAYKIGGSPVLSVPGNANTFAGLSAGAGNTSGGNGSFFGNQAGKANTTGFRNSFFGASSGLTNTTGSNNAFFGMLSGTFNSTGGNNTFVGDSAGFSNTTASGNTFVGASSGTFNTTGFANSFFGFASGNQNVTSNSNTFVGYFSGNATTVCCNSFFGTSAGSFNTTGTGNSYFGYLAGSGGTTASNNSYFGTLAGNATTGNDNAFFGFQSGAVNAAGFSNSFFGSHSGEVNTSGTNNAFFGTKSGQANTTGFRNTFLGTSSGIFTTTGGNNTFVGMLSGAFNVSGAGNTFVGDSAGFNNTGGNNTFVGFLGGLTNTVGTNNTTLGNGADVGANNLTFATAIGAGTTVSSSNTVVVGRAADTVQVPGALNVAGTLSFTTLSGTIINAGTQYNLGGNRILSAPGSGNTFGGFNAGAVNSSGSFNTFFGSNAGAANTTAINNAFFGQGAGFKNTSGANNTFLGNGAGLNTTSGPGNTFVGSLAGQGTVGGSNNTFLGVNAGTSNVGSGNNTFVGANTANSSLTGSGNSYFGANADGAILTTNATAIGFNAFAGQSNSLILGGINGVNGATADTSVGIGTTTPGARLHLVDNAATSFILESTSTSGAGMLFNNTSPTGRSWRIFADNGSNSCCTFHFVNTSGGEVFALTSGAAFNGNGAAFVNGDFSASGTISVGQLSNGGSTSVCRTAAGFLGNCSSSLRYKKDIAPFTSGLAMLNRLKPITFRWKADNALDLGFGAEDVAAVEPLLVTRNLDGQVEGVKYDRISAVLVNAVKEQQTQITEQENRLKEQESQIEALQRQIEELRQLLLQRDSKPNGDR